MGKPLPNRTSIVITRNKGYSVPEGHYVVHNFTDALDLVRSKDLEQVFVLGGAEIFEMSLPWVNQLIITEVDAYPEGDTYFPTLNYSHWEKIAEEEFHQDDKNEYNYSIVTYKRK